MTGKIIDRFEIKDRAALEYGAAGVVVVFKPDKGNTPPSNGDRIHLIRKDGWSYTGKAEDVREEPAAMATGLFLRGLCAEDVPLDAMILWGKEIEAVQSAVA